jgi:hypothetical protein
VHAVQADSCMHTHHHKQHFSADLGSEVQAPKGHVHCDDVQLLNFSISIHSVVLLLQGDMCKAFDVLVLYNNQS